MKDPQSLVARFYKARYFPESHFLEAEKQVGASYIWTGMMTTKNDLQKGFRWVVGNGHDINALRDSWPKNKVGCCVDQIRTMAPVTSECLILLLIIRVLGMPRRFINSFRLRMLILSWLLVYLSMMLMIVLSGPPLLMVIIR